MNMVVCLKQVRDPLTVRYDVLTEQLHSGEPITNPLDGVALEEALRLQEETGGEVVALTLGSPATHRILRDALLQGADRAIRVHVNQDTLDHQQRALVLSRALKQIGYDLILCGSRSADLHHEYVGTGIATHLGLPSVTRVVRVECETPGEVRLFKKVERGQREIYTCALPALVAVEDELCLPRYVSIMGRTYRAGLGKRIDVVTLAELALSESRLSAAPSYAAAVQQARPRTKGSGTTHTFWEQIQARKRSSQGLLPFSPEAVATCVAKLREWLGGEDG
jgi:electron transfer flavoprotein beta subunit